VFKIHVIHIIDDLKFDCVLHHAIIVHEALITLSHFYYDSLFHNESNLLPTSSFNSLSYPIPTIHCMPILLSHLVKFSIFKTLSEPLTELSFSRLSHLTTMRKGGRDGCYY
jgi:hypothetical protein